MAIVETWGASDKAKTLRSLPVTRRQNTRARRFVGMYNVDHDRYLGALGGFNSEHRSPGVGMRKAGVFTASS